MEGETRTVVELKRIQFKKALQSSFGAWKAERHPELAKGTRQFVRALRKSTRMKRLGLQ